MRLMMAIRSPTVRAVSRSNRRLYCWCLCVLAVVATLALVADDKVGILEPSSAKHNVTMVSDSDMDIDDTMVAIETEAPELTDDDSNVKETVAPNTDDDYHNDADDRNSSNDHGTTAISELSTTPVTKNVSSINSACSCRNSKAGDDCCQRIVFRTHKFGYMLTQELFKPFPEIQRMRPSPVLLDGSVDYRHVMMTRHIPSAIVSGYLYHKSGRECWLTFNGGSRGSLPEKTFRWENLITFPGNFPPGNKRSICRYLADESEEDGMRVYIDVALSKWYPGVLPYWRRVQERLVNGEESRTLQVCLEDASLHEEASFYRMMDFLYPGGHDYELPIRPPKGEYSGSHSTSHDPELRDRLLLLVKRLDDEIFGGVLADMQAAFRCGED